MHFLNWIDTYTSNEFLVRLNTVVAFFGQNRSHGQGDGESHDCNRQAVEQHFWQQPKSWCTRGWQPIRYKNQINIESIKISLPPGNRSDTFDIVFWA
jgi:hypothetical protein